METINAKALAEFEKKASKLIAKAWLEPEFCQALLKDPRSVFWKAGVMFAGIFVVFNMAGEAKALTLKEQTDDKVVYEISLPSQPDNLLDEKVIGSEIDLGPQGRPSSC